MAQVLDYGSWATTLSRDEVIGIAEHHPPNSRSLRTLPVGARVNVDLPGLGYMVDGEWVPLAQQSLVGPYRHGEPSEAATEETAEFVVPVRWIASHPKAEAHRERGIFASQHSACTLRQKFTLERLAAHFGLDEDG